MWSSQPNKKKTQIEWNWIKFNGHNECKITESTHINDDVLCGVCSCSCVCELQLQNVFRTTTIYETTAHASSDDAVSPYYSCVVDSYLLSHFDCRCPLQITNFRTHTTTRRQRHAHLWQITTRWCYTRWHIWLAPGIFTQKPIRFVAPTEEIQHFPCRWRSTEWTQSVYNSVVYAIVGCLVFVHNIVMARHVRLGIVSWSPDTICRQVDKWDYLNPYYLVHLNSTFVHNPVFARDIFRTFSLAVQCARRAFLLHLPLLRLFRIAASNGFLRKMSVGDWESERGADGCQWPYFQRFQRKTKESRCVERSAPIPHIEFSQHDPLVGRKFAVRCNLVRWMGESFLLCASHRRRRWRRQRRDRGSGAETVTISAIHDVRLCCRQYCWCSTLYGVWRSIYNGAVSDCFRLLLP